MKMDKKVTGNYIAGLLDSHGGFYIVERRTKKYLYFKMIVANKDIRKAVFEYLKDKLKINIREWNGILNITSIDGIQRLMQFMKVNCIRTDYEDMLIKHSFEVEKSIQ